MFMFPECLRWTLVLVPLKVFFYHGITCIPSIVLSFTIYIQLSYRRMAREQIYFRYYKMDDIYSVKQRFYIFYSGEFDLFRSKLFNVLQKGLKFFFPNKLELT